MGGLRFSFGFQYRKEIFLPIISIILIVHCRKALYCQPNSLFKRQFWGRGFLQFFIYISYSMWYTFEHWNHALFTRKVIQTKPSFSLIVSFSFYPPFPTCEIFNCFSILPQVLAIFLHSYFFTELYNLLSPCYNIEM